MKYLQETKQEAIRLASWEDLPSLAKCNSDIRPDWQVRVELHSIFISCLVEETRVYGKSGESQGRTKPRNS